MRMLASALVATFCFSISCMGNGASWNPIAVIPEKLDDMFYSGMEFVGYRLAPTLDIYCSNDGTNWTQHASALQPLSVGHDGNGIIYALTRTQTESGTPGWYFYTAQIWKSPDAQNWQHVVDLVTYFEIIPTSASFVANNDNLLIKLRNGWGAGWVSGSPPQPLFVASRTNPTNFVEVTGGSNLYGMFSTEGIFIGGRAPDSGGNFAVRSSDGIHWNDIFSLGNSYPATRVVSTWKSLFFTQGYWRNLSVQNELSRPNELNVPSNFTHGLNPLVGFAYDGRRLIVVGDNECYSSSDYTQTWTTNSFASVCGFAHNTDEYLIGDCAGTETIIYKLTNSTNDIVAVKDTPLRLNIQSQQEIELYPVFSNQFYQLECSTDLMNWHFYGIPTTNYPFSLDPQTFNSESMFFRTRKSQP